MSDLSVLDHVAQSNLPAEKKTSIRRFFEKMTGGVLSTSNAVGHVSAAGSAVREGGESLLIGAGLGLLDAEKGLDYTIGNNKVPIDGVLAAAGLLGSIALANHPLGIAPDLRHAGSLSLAILTFRKTKEWRENSKKPIPGAHGEGQTGFGDDPILRIANEL